MRLDPFIRDYPQFMDELVEVLESPQTRFYLDTSLLMWLVSLGSAARSEFLSWCGSRPETSVRIPVWAAHELHRHLTRQTVTTNIRSAVSETERKLDDFVRLASERADEEVCRASGYGSRQGFIAEVVQVFAKVKRLAKVVSSDSKLSGASDEVIKFVNEHTLHTDINHIIKTLGQTGDFRYSHLIPPGYHDKKDENRFGDVIIWEELLEDIRVDEGSERRHGVLVSRDEKTDWVSSAPLLKAGRAPERSNRDLDLDVPRAHPLLVHEFEGRARGGRLYVVPPSFLASALDYGSRKSRTASAVSNWLAAAHRPDLLARLAAAELPTAVPAESAPANPGEGQAAQAAVTPPSGDLAYSYPSAVELMKLPTADEAKSYLEATPLDQPALVQAWLGQLKSGAFAPERFGRVLAELSLRGQKEWLIQLPSLLEELKSELSLSTLNGVVLGATAPAYFDRYGEALRQPRKDLGAVVLLLERDTLLSEAFTTLAGFLAAADVELPYTPGKGRCKIRITVDAAEGSGELRTLRDVRVGGESVLAAELPEENPRRLSTLLGRERSGGCSGQELRALLSHEYLLPADLLSSDYDNKRFTWLPGTGLVSVDTSSPGGVSATVIDEEDDFE